MCSDVLITVTNCFFLLLLFSSHGSQNSLIVPTEHFRMQIILSNTLSEPSLCFCVRVFKYCFFFQVPDTIFLLSFNYFCFCISNTDVGPRSHSAKINYMWNRATRIIEKETFKMPQGFMQE